MAKHTTTRQENYRRLKQVGFNSKQANRFKDMSPKKIEQLIQTKEKQNKELNNVLGVR